MSTKSVFINLNLVGGGATDRQPPLGALLKTVIVTWWLAALREIGCTANANNKLKSLRCVHIC